MLVNTYTLPELVDLALRVPEIGAVNFNVLHTVLITIINQVGLRKVKPLCNIENPAVAQAALLNARLKPQKHRRSFSQESLQRESIQVSPPAPGPSETQVQPAPETEVADSQPPSDAQPPPQGQPSTDDPAAPDAQDAPAAPDAQDAPVAQPPPEDQAPPDAQATEEQRFERTSVAPQADEEPATRFQPPTGDELFPTGGQADKLQLVSEWWRANNINRRMDGAEEALQQLSSVMDQVVDKLEDILEITSHLQVEMSSVAPNVETLVEEVEDIKENKASVQEVEEVKVRTQIMEEEKVGKVELGPLMEPGVLESLASGGPAKVKIDEIEAVVVGMQEQMGDASVVDMAEKLDDISKEFSDLMEKLSRLNLDDEEERRTELENVKQKVRIAQDDIEDLHNISADLMADNKTRGKLMEEMQTVLNDVKFKKADREEMVAALELKADKTDLDLKVDKEEFLNTATDLGEAISGLCDKFTLSEEEWKRCVFEINEELKLKLAVLDYETLQIPIHNRIKALMYGLKKLKDVVRSVVHPEAAGITKCVSCGRPAQLAGAKFKPCGGPCSAPPDMAGDKAGTKDKATPVTIHELRLPTPDDKDDDDAEKSSFISLPDEILSKTSILTEPKSRKPTSTKKGRGEKYPQFSLQPSSQETQSAVTLQSEHTSRIGTPPPILSKPAIGLDHRMPRRTIDEEFERLVATQSKTRFCGGRHTMTDPLQKGLHFTDLLMPPRTSREDINIMGYDKALYYGSIPAEKIGELPPDVDPNTVDSDALVDPRTMDFPPVPPRDASGPRYCGGSHTQTDPLQKGVKFAPLKLSTDPYRRDIGIQGTDGSIYRGASAAPSTSADVSVKPGTFQREMPRAGSPPVSEQDGSRRRTLIPSVVSLHLDDEPQTEGAMLTTPFDGYVVEIPATQLQRANQPRTIPGSHYAPPHFHGESKKSPPS